MIHLYNTVSFNVLLTLTLPPHIQQRILILSPSANMNLYERCIL